MIIRLSQKLASKIKTGPLPTLPLDENQFADWSAHLFVAARTQYIILSNTKSLYSTVMHAKGITNDCHLIERALNNMREFMEDDGLQFIYRRFIAPATSTVRFAKALDRSVTGSMNDLIVQASAMLIEGGLPPYEVGVKLNDVLLSAIAPSKAEAYGRPREVFKTLASGNGP